VFTARDIATIAGRMRDAGAVLALTTEKDVTRLLPWRPLPVPVAWVPLVATVEPADDFQLWLRGRLRRARDARFGGAVPPDSGGQGAAPGNR
jgi:hypothetical protein